MRDIARVLQGGSVGKESRQQAGTPRWASLSAVFVAIKKALHVDIKAAVTCF